MWVWGLETLGLGFSDVQGLGFRDLGVEFGVSGLGFSMLGLGFGF